VCQIRMLIIGDSVLKNNNAIRTVKSACVAKGWLDVVVQADAVNPHFNTVIDPDSYDMAVVDERSLNADCSSFVLGCGTPTLKIVDVYASSTVFEGVIQKAVEHSRMRDKIASVTEHIEETSRMLAAV